MKRVRLLLWAALFAAGVAAVAAHQMGAGAAERTEKGDFGRMPAFTLTDQAGRTVSDRDLRGKPVLVNFIFTRCPTACPMLTAKFKALQERMGAVDARFVSISVDPEHDTPEVLREYAAKYGADAARWLFLTGPLTAIEKTVIAGFKIHMGAPQPNDNNPTLIDIMHGEHFVLVDREGTIRGYYRAEQAELAELARDAEQLAKK